MKKIKPTRTSLAAFAVVSGLGLWSGTTWGGADPASAAGRAAQITGMHGESPFYVSLAAVASKRDGDRETLDLAARVGNRQDRAMRGLVSLAIEDDRGHTIQDARISPVVAVAGKAEAHAASLSTPRLADGFYRVRAQAVFAEGKDVRGAETDSLYLEVTNGSIQITEMSDWYQRSRANGAQTP